MVILDDELITVTVGPAGFARGLEHLARGAVVGASIVTRAGHGPRVVGAVRDGRAQPYTVTVSLVGHPGSVPLLAFGRCSCDLRSNCDHVAAVMLAAAHQRRPAGTWESAPGGTPGPDLAEPTRPIGLQISWDGGGHGTLAMRPVMLSERGRWVTGGISWA
jgi:hypothetical protein